MKSPADPPEGVRGTPGIRYRGGNMSSAHPDFASVASESITSDDIRKILQERPPEAIKTLNGHLTDVDAERGIARFRFEIVPAFCHSGGRICQGGFLTGMVDSAMAHAAIAKGKLQVAVPTLELKISFFEAMGPGIVHAEGRVMRWGGSVGFLDGDIRDEKGRLIVHATSTIKIIRPKK
jgi:acyl-CoA thioesterase